MNSLPATFVEGFHDREAVKKMKYKALGETGLTVSNLSFGASSLGSVFRETNDAESIRVVHHAIKSGINYIDVAPWYGHGKAETVLGKALKDVPREAYYIATKVGRYQPELLKMFDFSAERTLQSVDESLKRLGVDYLDIIQVHDMEFASSLDIIINETLPALEKAKDSGKVKFIGITGYPLINFRTVLERSKVNIDTVLSYCHCCLHDTELLDYKEYFKKHGIGIVNASPISMGLLSSRGPPSWHPAGELVRNKCKEAADYCQKQGVDISKVALHFTLEMEDIPTTLVSTASIQNLQKNIDAVNAKLTDKEGNCLQFIRNNIFKPSGNLSWEGVEVAKYWQKMKAL
ncbi:PREDICTED: L-galactose dehydrogenase-like [Acropora digitifera]|uniref:L-galactose dehydrogenase-like n=1 Tax=Acropora digitifera TaxID=70779 RepID=UPI00077A0C8F|nr:PREDICTED: L-galactose dehydrogenase-like [Acropora digitifera]